MEDGRALRASVEIRGFQCGVYEFVFGDVTCVDDLAVLHFQGQVFKPVSGKQLLQPVAIILSNR